MADKTVTVKLQATTQAFEAAMQRASGSVKNVAGAGTDAVKSLGGMSSQARQLGGDMTRYVTVPLVAAGVAAVKLASDFDQTFKKMTALAGVTTQQVDGLKSSVEALAGETGRGPQELADALYFASSAGYDAATSLDIVNKAAHASAAGLGTTDAVVQAVTNVMGAYGSANISAGQATDILVAAARDAKIEASELAPQLGRLLPPAKLLGVGFADVAGAMAFLSTVSGDASLSATQLGGVLEKLVRPTQQGQDALAGVGLSVDDLHAAIQDKGLAGALDLLKTRFAGNTQELGKFFDDAQAFQGAALLMTDTTGNLSKALDDTAHAAGATDDAFAKTDGSARDMEKAWANIQVAVIQFGEVLAPIAADVASFLAAVAGAVSSLPGPLQASVVGFAALLAAVGPVLALGGKLADNFKTIRDALGRVTDRLNDMPRGARLATAALAGITVALVGIETFAAKRSDRSNDFIKNLVGDLDTSNIDDVSAALSKLQAEREKALSTITPSDKLFTIPGIDANVFSSNDAADAQDRIDKLNSKIGDLKTVQAQLADQSRVTADKTGALGSAAKTAADGGLTDEAAQIAAVTQALKDQADAIKAQLDPFFAVTDAFAKNASAQQKVAAASKAATTGVAEHQEELAKRVTDAQENLADAQKRLASATEGERDSAARAVRDASDALDQAYQDQANSAGDAQQAQQDLEAANFDAVKSAEDVQVALLQLATSVSAGTTSIDDARRNLQSWVDQGLITQEQADLVAGRFDTVGGRAGELATTVGTLNASGLNLQVTAPGLDEALAKAQQLAQLAAVTVGILTGQLKIGPNGELPSLPPIPSSPGGDLLGAIIAGSQPTGKASGGSLLSGDHVVGEDGFEFVRNGYVYPHAQSVAMMSAHQAPLTSSTSTSSTRNVYARFYITAPPQQAAERVHRILSKR